MATLILTYGRFQGIHKGHEKIFDEMLRLSGGIIDAQVYTSTSAGSVKNPLPMALKCNMLNILLIQKKMHCVRTFRTLMSVLEDASTKYTDIIFVCGGDRVEHFDKIIKTYNGVHYDFDTIQVLSAGERNDERESATFVRDTALNGSYEEFAQLLPELIPKNYALDMYNQLRHYLNSFNGNNNEL